MLLVIELYLYCNVRDDDEIELPQQKTGTILLADDNSDMREYVASLLQRKWDVKTVCDGLEALETLKAQPAQFDLVLSDIMVNSFFVIITFNN